ncbi:MAG: EamA family transporter [Firmicutes bacterium HGW-Firmicutes-16]|nr:MAG: EamA family transporter [Firmicutes bacterium HGW-Firmicutes-16]
MSIDEKKKYAVLGRGALLITTLIWGTSFVVLKNTLNSVPTLYILAFRFSGAAILLAIMFFKELKKIDKRYLINGIVLGTLLFCGYTVQTYGLFYTTPSKNAFLTAAYCVLVPFVVWFVSKKRPDKYNFISTAICIVGVGLVSLKNDRTVELGDLLTVCSSVFYATHIVLTSKYVKGRSVAIITMIQFATAGVLGWISALVTTPFPTSISTGNILSILYLCVMCTAVCFMFQTFGQKHTPPSTAAIILTLESVFGASFSVFINHEVLTLKLYVGFVLIFVAVLISETKLSFLKRKRITEEESVSADPEPKLFD